MLDTMNNTHGNVAKVINIKLNIDTLLTDVYGNLKSGKT